MRSLMLHSLVLHSLVLTLVMLAALMLAAVGGALWGHWVRFSEHIAEFPRRLVVALGRTVSIGR